jgi:hypothetical protein
MTGREGTPGGLYDQLSGDDALVGSVARQLRLINRSAGWARTTALGEAVINSFFDGDCESFRSSPRRADQSLRRIAAHAGCPLKKSALATAVHVYAFVVEHPEVREWEHVLPGHVATVLKCQADERLALLQHVQLERPTMKAFALHVAMQGNTPTKATALPPARLAGAVLSVLHSVETEQARAHVSALQSSAKRGRLNT